MFISNIRFNSKKTPNLHNTEKIILTIVCILAIIIVCVAGFNLYSAINKKKAESIAKNSRVIELTSDNYTSFLKESHDSIEDFTGSKVSGTGYIYRMPDFKDNQFVLSRTMLIPSTNQGVVVGILCENNDASNYKNGDWIHISGTIKIGDYHGKMPIIDVESISSASVPDDEFVYPPSE